MARTPSCPRLQRDREMCAGPNCVCSGRGGLFRTELGEPAGPPFVLAESLKYNQLQEHDLDGFEAILEFYSNTFVS